MKKLTHEHYLKIKQAFVQLRKKGYFCRMNFWCCQSCAWFAVPEDKAEKVVFFHQQDAAAFGSYGHMHLAWSGDVKEITQALEAQGLTVEAPKDSTSRIKVVV